MKGEVKLRSFTADPAGIAAYSPLENGLGERIEIVKIRTQTDGFIAVLKGVADRNAAEALKGTELFVPRERLTEPQEGEVYLRDLTGLEVWDRDKRLGKVIATPDYGAGALLEVKVEYRNDTVLIPFTANFVTGTNLEGGKIVVDLPEGFLDEEER